MLKLHNAIKTESAKKQTEVRLSCVQRRAHCLFPLASDAVSQGVDAWLGDADSSGWQMPGFFVDALHQLMTDVRALLGREHFIMLPRSPSLPHCIHQPAWQMQGPTPLQQPYPPLPHLFVPTYTHTHSDLCIHQSSVITSDSRHTGNQ